MTGGGGNHHTGPTTPRAQMESKIWLRIVNVFYVYSRHILTSKDGLRAEII